MHLVHLCAYVEGRPRDLHRKYAGQANFLGVKLTSYLGSDMLPNYTTQGLKDPLATSFEDVTLARFTADIKLTVPGTANDPQRFGQRAEFLLSAANKDKWLQWRTEKTRDFFTKLQREVGGTQSFISLYVDVNHAQGWKTSGLTVRDYLRQFGWSPEVYQNQPGLWFPKWTHATQRYASMVKIKTNELWPAAWDMSVSDEYNRTFDQPANRASFVMTHWQEHEEFAETLAARDGWPRPFQMTYQAQANSDNAREVFTQNLLTTDPQMVVWGFCDLVMQTGHEQPLREFARVLHALPKAKFQPALDTTLESNLVLRELHEDGKLWFIAANPGYWPLQAEIYVTGANGIHDATSTALVAAIIANGKTILPLNLKPYEVRACRVDNATAKLQGWKNEAVPEIELAHTRAVIADAEKLLNDKAYNARLPSADREFLTAQMAAANTALASQHIEKAWSLVSDSRFWSLARTQWIGGKPR